MEEDMNNNNNVAIIVVGLLGFIAIAITGKWLLLDKHDGHPRFEQPVQQVQVPVRPPAVCKPYPHVYPEYHRSREFWMGYSDGWNGFAMRMNMPAYNQGYAIGVHDRACNHPYYHLQYCPPGFSLRLPGFSLNIR